MKKIILPALFGVMLLASCKKDYTCECTSVSTSVGTDSGTSTDTDASKTVYKDVSKKYMQNAGACYSSESSYSYENWIGTNPNTFEPEYETVKVTNVNTCELKK
jgi:hypothetical protein